MTMEHLWLLTKFLDIVERCLILMSWNSPSLCFLSCEFYCSFLFSKEKYGCSRTWICTNLHCEEGVNFSRSIFMFSPLIGFKFKLHGDYGNKPWKLLLVPFPLQQQSNVWSSRIMLDIVLTVISWQSVLRHLYSLYIYSETNFITSCFMWKKRAAKRPRQGVTLWLSHEYKTFIQHPSPKVIGWFMALTKLKATSIKRNLIFNFFKLQHIQFLIIRRKSVT